MSEQSGPSATEEVADEGPNPSVRGSLTAGVLCERSDDERRVALVPDDIAKLSALSIDVLVEKGAGTRSFFPDASYAQAGATIVDRSECLSRSNVILCVTRPDQDDVHALGAGQVVVGMLEPLVDPGYAQALATRGAIGVSLDLLPRTLSRAQSMDALSSQSSIAGYKAALVGASEFTRYFPLLMTAAGTSASGRGTRPWRRRRRPAGDRYCAPTRRCRTRLRRPTGREGAGGIPRWSLHRAHGGHRCRR